MKRYLVLIIALLSSFLAHSEGIKLSCQPEQPICLNCPEYVSLFPLGEFSPDNSNLDIEADESEILSNQIYHLTGDVIVKSDQFILTADDVEVDSINETTTAIGDVRFQDNAFLISGDKLIAKKDADKNLTATVTSANYQDYLSGQGGANGLAEIIQKNPNSVLLKNATYSLCPVNKNDWLIDATSIELDLDNNRGKADNAKVVFYGVPIFYMPRYSWVLQGRGSGFLTPDYDNYKETALPGQDPKSIERSYRIRVPYYFNIAPDRDLVAALTFMSSRGLIYEGTYRQLIAPKISEEKADSIWKTEVIYLNTDKMTKLKRWLLDTSVEVDFSEKLHLSSNYYRVSDKEYFKEILRTNTLTKRLISNIKLAYTDNENELTAILETDHEQIVNAGIPKYTKDIEGSVLKTFRFGRNKITNYKAIQSNLELSEEDNLTYLSENPIPTLTNLKSNFVSTKFAHSDESKESGVRTYGSLILSKKLPFIKYPSITPNTNISITNYSLNKNNKDITRTIGGAGFQVDFSTVSKVKLFDTEVNHRFMPIITYNYKAKKLQGNIPIFDSTDKHDDIITFADLTSGERYTGLDRVTNANDINLSLESSFRDVDALKDDKDFLNMKITQTYYTDSEVVSDNSIQNYEARKKYSDIAASISLAVNDISLSSTVQFNPDKSLIVKKENKISYSPNTQKFISLSYSDDGLKRIGKIYGAYPLSPAIHMFGGLNREIVKLSLDGTTKTYTTGLAYEACCWAVRVAHFQEDKGQGDKSNNYSTGVELILKGLGSTSTPMKGRIENNIEGYSSKFW